MSNDATRDQNQEQEPNQNTPTTDAESTQKQENANPPKKPYTKPQLVRYGTINELTASGNPGQLMDSVYRTEPKTGF